MRIALFSGNYNYLREGANQALNILVRYLENKAGHQVRVYSPVTDTPAFEPAGTLIPVPSVTLPVRTEFQLALTLPRSIRRDVQSFRPDIVHISTPDILNLRAQSLARELGVPVVASLHTLFETYLGFYGLGWAKPGVDAYLRRFYRRSDHVLAPTPTLVEDLKRIRGDDRVSLWSRGIHRDLFNPARRDQAWRRDRGVGDDEVLILFFGRLVLEKGVDAFAATLRMLQGRGSSVRALVVGAGPAASIFDAIPGSIMTGHIEGTELARTIASADMMLTPSTTETFGNVVLEAMASGVPVVSADVPSARALIEQGKTGLLCPERDIPSYANAIASLIDDPAGRRAMGLAAREASAAFTWDSASASVARCYEFCVSRPDLRQGIKFRRQSLKMSSILMTRASKSGSSPER